MGEIRPREISGRRDGGDFPTRACVNFAGIAKTRDNSQSTHTNVTDNSRLVWTIEALSFVIDAFGAMLEQIKTNESLISSLILVKNELRKVFKGEIYLLN